MELTMNPGCYLLFVEPTRLGVITRITPLQLEYDYWSAGRREFGILAKYSLAEFVDMGIHKGKNVFGYLSNTTDFPQLQAALATIEAVSRAKEQASLAIENQKAALAKAELSRRHKERAELARRQAELEEAQQRQSQAFQQLDPQLEKDFIGAHSFWHEHLRTLISEDVFRERRTAFTKDWFRRCTDLLLDEEQAGAVGEYGPHVQVTARAGSGKTRTLVARALFQIKHCRIPASSILILAFNKKAVEEIRERLANYLDEEGMPHVLTFHALAYRIVRPQEDLIYDEGEAREGQVFSGTIQRIIDAELRGGPLELELRTLMEARWAVDLSHIIKEGYDLPMEEFFVYRTKLPRVTMDGRKVSSEAHKHIGNALLRHRIRYSYRKTLQRNAGAAYSPDFSHYNKEKDNRIIIEVLDENGTEANPAREFYWKSDYSKNSRLIQVLSHANAEATEISQQVANGLRDNGVSLSPMSDDELWEAIRDRAIDDFTKAAKQFISRCQKELITPERLSEMVDHVACHCAEVQERFWRLCVKIFSRYLVALTDGKKTDFDQLMRKAAEMIEEGQTRFTSSRGSGNLSNIRHVLIDEFQDFSHLFNELRKSFIGQSPDAKFFCVGDDWQAINKFAGSDLRYFTGFGNVFQPSTQKLISRNYRSCTRIVEAGNQVMTGEGQPSIPNRKEAGFVGLVQTDDDIRYTEAEEIVIEELGEQAVPILRIASESASRGLEVAVLSRNGSTATPEGMLKLDSWERKLRQFLPEEHRELLKVSTMHGYKGKESDVVILLGPEHYPSIHPDAIFNTIFGDTFESNEADEKRLFYVGITRARSQLFLLRDKENPSSHSSGTFLRLISNQSSYNINNLSARLVCGTRVIVRLANVPGFVADSGTYPIRDLLKWHGFKWSEENKAWSCFLESGSISSPFECGQHLQRQAWLKDADGIVATFAWEDQRHSMRINKGTVVPDGSSPPPQDGPMSIGGQWKPISGWTGQTTASTRPTSSVVRPIASRPRHGASPPPVTLATNLNQSDRPVKSTGAPNGVFETSIAGMRYEGRMQKASHLSAGDFVRLEREPGNTHDRNAIKVVTSEGVHIGYLSRHVAAHLAKGLDAWGGIWQAKVGSVWKQPLPHFLVSVQICFPLPPGVVIPEELDAAANLEDSPFTNSRPSPKSVATTPLNTLEGLKPDQHSLDSREDVPNTSPDSLIPDAISPDAPLPPRSGALTQAQIVALGDLLDPSLGSLITDLYLSGCCPWPYIGYEGLDSEGRCTDAILEVAWPDFKVGIALPTNETTPFVANGWTVLPAATVTASTIQRLFATATEAAPSPRQESTGQTDMPAAPIDPSPSIGDFPTTDRRFQHGQFQDEEPDDDIPF